MYHGPGYVYPKGQGHSPWIAALLTIFCFTCAGAIYNGQAIKGIVMMLVGMVASVLTGGLALLVLYPAMVADAALIAAKLQRGDPVREWDFF